MGFAIPFVLLLATRSAAASAPEVHLPVEVGWRDPTAGLRSPEPGRLRGLKLPAFIGPADTPLGNEALFRARTPLERAWFVREYHRARGDAVSAETSLSTLIEVLHDAGLENAPTIAAALALESRELVRADKAAQAIPIAKAATELFPDGAEAHLALAAAQFAAGRYDDVATSMADAAAATWRNLRSRTRLIANAWVTLFSGIFLAHAAALALLLLRHRRSIVHDFRHALTDRIPVWAAALVLLPFLGFPLLFGLGPIPLLGWLTLCLWPASARRERLLGALFLVAWIVSPLVVRQIGFGLAFETSEANTLFAAAHEGAVSDDELSELAAIPDLDRDPDRLLILGNAHLRSGRYDLAEQHYERALKAGDSRPWVGIGILRYASGSIADAIGAWEKALSYDPSRVAAMFNLSRAYAERTEIERSTSNIAAARKIDAKACDRLLGRKLLAPHQRKVGEGESLFAADYLNRLFMLDSVSDARLLERASAGGAAEAVARQTWRHLSPAVPLSNVPVLFGSFLVAALAIGIGSRGAVPARSCPRCGRGLCVRCDGAPLDEDLCVQCFHAFVKGDGVDPKQRALKEAEVQRHAARMRRWRWALSLLLPGGGRIYAGETLRGAILLVPGALVAARIAFGRGLLRSDDPSAGSAASLAVAVAAVVLGLLWLLGLRGGTRAPAGLPAAPRRIR